MANWGNLNKYKSTEVISRMQKIRKGFFMAQTLSIMYYIFMADSPKKGYGKRPLWQWILLYVIIAAVVYGAVYYFVFAKKGGYDTGSTQNTAPYSYGK